MLVVGGVALALFLLLFLILRASGAARRSR